MFFRRKTLARRVMMKSDVAKRADEVQVGEWLFNYGRDPIQVIGRQVNDEGVTILFCSSNVTSVYLSTESVYVYVIRQEDPSSGLVTRQENVA